MKQRKNGQRGIAQHFLQWCPTENGIAVNIGQPAANLFQHAGLNDVLYVKQSRFRLTSFAEHELFAGEGFGVQPFPDQGHVACHFFDKTVPGTPDGDFGVCLFGRTVWGIGNIHGKRIPKPVKKNHQLSLQYVCDRFVKLLNFAQRRHAPGTGRLLFLKQIFQTWQDRLADLLLVAQSFAINEQGRLLFGTAAKGHLLKFYIVTVFEFFMQPLFIVFDIGIYRQLMYRNRLFRSM